MIPLILLVFVVPAIGMLICYLIDSTPSSKKHYEEEKERNNEQIRRLVQERKEREAAEQQRREENEALLAETLALFEKRKVDQQRKDERLAKAKEKQAIEKKLGYFMIRQTRRIAELGVQFIKGRYIDLDDFDILEDISYELIDCDIDELRSWLEDKFDVGMNWGNYGLEGWHIDHIRPLSSIDINDESSIFKVCHFTNLQPLWAEENRDKCAYWNGDDSHIDLDIMD